MDRLGRTWHDAGNPIAWSCRSVDDGKVGLGPTPAICIDFDRDLPELGPLRARERRHSMSTTLWGFIGGGVAGLAISCVILAFALLRSAARATARKRPPLFTTVSALPLDEVRTRLIDRVADAGFSVANADLEDGIVLASRASLRNCGFFLPVYLTVQPDGQTLIEIGAVPRGLPTYKKGMAEQQTMCLQVIELAVAQKPAWAVEPATPGGPGLRPSPAAVAGARRAPSRHPRRLGAVALAGAVVAALLSAAAFGQTHVPSTDTGLPVHVAPGSRVDLAMTRISHRMLADPLIKARFKDLKSVQAVVDQGGALLDQGVKRVDVATLERYARTSQTLLLKADDTTCAQWSRGEAAPQLGHALEQLTDAELSEYFDVRYALVAAAAHGDATAAPLTEAEANRAAAVLRRSLGEADAELLGEPSNAGQPDAEACRISRKLFTSTIALPPDDRALVLRHLFQT